MVESDKPINPIPPHARTLENGRAQDFFDDVASDPQVQRHWRPIQLRLRGLMEEIQKREVRAQSARARTATVLKPIPLATPFTDSLSQPALTKLADGQVLVAYLTSSHLLRVVRLSDGDEIFSRQMETPASDAWRICWHRDGNGAHALYLTGYVSSLFSEGTAIYKYQSTNTGGEFTRLGLKVESKKEKPWRLKDLGPDYLLLETYEKKSLLYPKSFYNIAGGRIGIVPTELEKPSAEHPPVGELFSWLGQPILSSPSGRTFSYHLVPSEKKLIVTEIGPGSTFEYDLPSDSRLDGNKASLFESPRGEVYLAFVQMDHRNGDQIHVVRIGGARNPVFSFQLNERRLRDGLFSMFLDRSGALNLAVHALDPVGKSILEVFNIGDRELVLEYRVKGLIEGWFELGDNVYFTSFDNDSGGTIQIHSLFSPSRD